MASAVTSRHYSRGSPARPPATSPALDLDAQDTVGRRQLADDVESEGHGGEVVVLGGRIAALPGRLEDEELRSADGAVREPRHAQGAGLPLLVGGGRLRLDRVARAAPTGPEGVPRLHHPVLRAPEGQAGEV